MRRLYFHPSWTESSDVTYQLLYLYLRVLEKVVFRKILCVEMRQLSWTFLNSEISFIFSFQFFFPNLLLKYNHVHRITNVHNFPRSDHSRQHRECRLQTDDSNVWTGCWRSRDFHWPRNPLVCRLPSSGPPPGQGSRTPGCRSKEWKCPCPPDSKSCHSRHSQNDHQLPHSCKIFLFLLILLFWIWLHLSAIHEASSKGTINRRYISATFKSK